MAFSKKNKEQVRDAHGRDSKGQFKNHAAYLEILNKVNTKEKSHLPMFTKINKKLSDDSFIMQHLTQSLKIKDENTTNSTE